MPFSGSTFTLPAGSLTSDGSVSSAGTQHNAPLTDIANALTQTMTAATSVFTGDSGVGGLKGLVPDPAAGDAAEGKVLSAGGGWVGSATVVQSRTEMAALDTAVGAVAELVEGGRSGLFAWSPDNLAARVTSDTRQGRYVAPASAPTGASGAWVRVDPVLRLPHFGIGEGDDTSALQGFYDEGFAYFYIEADISGKVDISGPVTWGQDSLFSATFNWPGRMELTALAGSGFAVITINGLRNCRIGSVYGTVYAGAQYVNRTRFTNGVWIKNGGRLTYENIYFRGISGFSVFQTGSSATVPPSNTNSCNGLVVHGEDCGSGYSVSSYTGNLNATFTSRTSNGSSSSPSQTTTLNNISAFPPPDVISMFSDMGAPVGVLIAGEIYQVSAFDVGANSLSVYGWVDLGVSAGTLTYIFGGVLCSIGSDANVHNVGRVFGLRCGISYVAASLYPGDVGLVLGEVVGAPAWIGAAPTAGWTGGSITMLYSESTIADLVTTSRGLGGNQYFNIMATGPFQISKIVNTAKVRSSTNQFASNYSAAGVSINADGYRYEAGKRGNNFDISGATYTFEVGLPDVTHTIYKSAPTLNPQVPRTGAVRNFGYDKSTVNVIGTAASRAPSSVTVNVPPSTDYTAVFDVVTNSVPVVGYNILQNGSRVRFTTTGTLPAGITAGNDYYLVKTSGSNNTAGTVTTNHSIAASLANATAHPPTIITLVDAGTGTHTMTQPSFLNGGEVALIYSSLRGPFSAEFFYNVRDNNLFVAPVAGDTQIINGSLVTDPPDLGAGLTQTFTVTVPGAALGMPAYAAFSQYHVDMLWSATVSATDTVLVKQKNDGAASVNLLSGTLRVGVLT